MAKKKLEFIVLDAESAAIHSPKKKALAIRIFASYAPGTKETLPKLKNSLYKKVLEYTFDDIDVSPEQDVKAVKAQCTGYSVFDKKLAKKIITDFGKIRRNISEIVVHCYAGASRSPAVAQALNDIFSLRFNFKEVFPRTNLHVYRTMIEAAQEMGYEPEF